MCSFLLDPFVTAVLYECFGFLPSYVPQVFHPSVMKYSYQWDGSVFLLSRVILSLSYYIYPWYCCVFLNPRLCSILLLQHLPMRWLCVPSSSTVPSFITTILSTFLKIQYNEIYVPHSTLGWRKKVAHFLS